MQSDALYLIFRYLDFKDIHSCLLVNRQFYDIANYDLIWKFLLEKYYKGFKHRKLDYKKTFKFYHRLNQVQPFIFNCCDNFDPNNFKKLERVYFKDYFANFKKYTKFPIGICYLENLKELEIENMLVTQLSPKISRLTRLNKLSILRTPVEKLPDEIAKLSNLKTLLIGNTAITHVPDYIFNLPRLKILTLSGNCAKSNERFTGICYKKLYRQTNLKQLFLSHNEMSSLSSQIQNLTNLATLQLNNNILDKLPNQLSYLRNLILLDLSHNNLSSNEVNKLYKLRNLTTLNISNNKITVFPISLYRLKTLICLNLSNNNIADIPGKIKKFITLKDLSLRNNSIKSLPDNFFHLLNLKYLDLSMNKLLHVSTRINKLTHLRSLDLLGNPLTNGREIKILCGNYIDHFEVPIRQNIYNYLWDGLDITTLFKGFCFILSLLMLGTTIAGMMYCIIRGFLSKMA